MPLQFTAEQGGLDNVVQFSTLDALGPEQVILMTYTPWVIRVLTFSLSPNKSSRPTCDAGLEAKACTCQALQRAVHKHGTDISKPRMSWPVRRCVGASVRCICPLQGFFPCRLECALKVMDRWGDDDLGPRAPAGNVARLGMGGFVKSDTGARNLNVAQRQSFHKRFDPPSYTFCIPLGCLPALANLSTSCVRQ